MPRLIDYGYDGTVPVVLWPYTDALHMSTAAPNLPSLAVPSSVSASSSPGTSLCPWLLQSAAGTCTTTLCSRSAAQLATRWCSGSTGAQAAAAWTVRRLQGPSVPWPGVKTCDGYAPVLPRCAPLLECLLRLLWSLTHACMPGPLTFCPLGPPVWL